VASAAAGIPSAYAALKKDLNELWEVHVALSQYLPAVAEGVTARRLDALHLAPFTQPANLRDKSVKTTVGVLQRARSRDPYRTLVDAVGRFEVFIGAVARTTYLAFGADRLSGRDGVIEESQQTRIIEWVFESKDRDEIIDRIVEDKIRSLTYGNGKDLLVRDRARLSLGDHFKSGHDETLNQYAEIISRRNVIVHSGGQVDRRYLAAHPDSGFRLHGKVPVTDIYLAGCLTRLRQLAACVTYVSGSAVAGRGLGGDIERQFISEHRTS
jgi:hypothetical protein